MLKTLVVVFGLVTVSTRSYSGLVMCILLLICMMFYFIFWEFQMVDWMYDVTG